MVTGLSHQTKKLFKVLTAGNYKLVRGILQNSEQLQNNFVNGAMLITINQSLFVYLTPAGPEVSIFIGRAKWANIRLNNC